MELGLVDPIFPLISTAVPSVEYLNLRDPSASPVPLPCSITASDASPRRLTGPPASIRIPESADPSAVRITADRPNPPRPLMPSLRLMPLDRPEVAPLPISPRLQGQLVYFMTPPAMPGLPDLDEGDYWFARDEVARWLDDGVFYLVSPLDSANATEVELTEEQESFLTWLQKNDVQHVRLLE